MTENNLNNIGIFNSELLDEYCNELRKVMTFPDLDEAHRRLQMGIIEELFPNLCKRILRFRNRIPQLIFMLY